MILIKNIDNLVIPLFKKYEIALSRFAIFLVYFWFGGLKVVGLSPATPLVKTLFDATLSSFVSFEFFYILFSLFEVLIGILFLIKGFERVAILLVLLHLFTTILPLAFLPEITWQGFLVPTLEGQYIIKNILILATTVVIGSRLNPL